MATQRQKKAIKNIVENGGVVSKAMIKAGYTQKTAKTPSKLTNSKAFKKELKPLLDRLETERDRAIKKLSGKISKAKYRDLIDGIDKITKNIQLLSNKPTDNFRFSLKDLFEETKDE